MRRGLSRKNQISQRFTRTKSCITNWAVPDGWAGRPRADAMPKRMPVSRTVGAVLSPGPGRMVKVPEEKGVRPPTLCGRQHRRAHSPSVHADRSASLGTSAKQPASAPLRTACGLSSQSRRMQVACASAGGRVLTGLLTCASLMLTFNRENTWPWGSRSSVSSPVVPYCATASANSWPSPGPSVTVTRPSTGCQSAVSATSTDSTAVRGP